MALRGPISLIVLGAALLTLAPASAWAQQAARPLSLEAAVSLAIEHNEQIGIADAAVMEANGAIWEAKSDALPQLSGAAQYTRNLTKPKQEIDMFGPLAPLFLANGLPPPGPVEQDLVMDNDWVFNLRLEQALYTFGRLGNAIRLAKAYDGLARRDRSRVEKNVRLQTEEAYYLALLARETVDINQQALDQAQRRRDEIKAKRDQGLVSDYDLMAAETEVAKLRPNVLNAKRNYETALLALKLQIGLPLDEQIVLTDELRDVPFELGLDQALDEALANRDDIKILQNKVQASKYEAGIYRSNWMPILSAFGDLTYTGSVNDDLWPQEDEFYDFTTVGVVLAWPIFDGMASWSKVRQAKAREQSSELSLSQATRGIELEVTSLYKELGAIEEEIRAHKQTVMLAERTYELAQIRFSSGLSTHLEVNDALLNVTSAKTGLAEAVYRHSVTRARLVAALGR